jgi:hypothetical protein
VPPSVAGGRKPPPGEDATRGSGADAGGGIAGGLGSIIGTAAVVVAAVATEAAASLLGRGGGVGDGNGIIKPPLVLVLRAPNGPGRRCKRLSRALCAALRVEKGRSKRHGPAKESTCVRGL